MSAQPLLLTSSPSEVWVSFTEAMRLTGKTRRWMAMQIADAKLRFRLIPDRIMGNGRPDREFALSSLPPYAQQRYAREQAALAPAPQMSLSLFAAPQLVKPAPRVRIAPQQTSEAMRKQQVLEPILAMRDEATRRAYAASLRTPGGQPVDSQNRMIEYVIAEYAAQGIELSARTIKRWIAAHKDEGAAGLQRKRRNDAGQSRWFSQPEHRSAAELVAYLYLGDGLRPGLSAEKCWEMLAAQHELVGVDEQDLPHYHTVRNFIASAPASLKVFARRGREEFAGRMLPHISRSYLEPANSIWVSDTMIADVEVMNDCIPGAKLGDPIRLRLTAIIDYRSRYVVGYSWAWEGSSASIANALRRAVIAHGPCDIWYCDNGKDYLKVAKGAVPAYMKPGSIEAEDWAMREMERIEHTGILARLGIRVEHCIVRHPQSKHVERFFRTLHEQFCKLWPTYTGGKPSERPDQTSALMALHRNAMLHGDLSRSQHPLASEFIAKFEGWLANYHNRQHEGEGMNDRTPAQVFAQERNRNQKPAPPKEDLAWLLWDHKRVLVRDCEVRVNKVSYAPKNDVEAQLLFDRAERLVTIAYDKLDSSCVAVLDEDNRLLTMLDSKELVRFAPDDPATQKAIADMMQMRGRLVKGVGERRKAITTRGKQLGVYHPLELLQAPTSTDTTGQITPRNPGLAPQSQAVTPTLHHEDILARTISRMGGAK